MNLEQETIIISLQKADECLLDAEILIKENRSLAVVNRSYYAVFYSLSALALKYGFQTAKHQQLIGWFNREFIKTGKVEIEIGRIAMKIYEQRIRGDYDMYNTFSDDQTAEIRRSATIFVEAIKKLFF